MSRAELWTEAAIDATDQDATRRCLEAIALSLVDVAKSLNEILLAIEINTNTLDEQTRTIARGTRKGHDAD